MEHNALSWQMYEFHHAPKSADWYWTLGIISVALAIVFIFLKNPIFALLIIVAAITLALHASKPPRLIEYHLTHKGAIIDNRMHPFSTIESYWIEEHDHKASKLLLKSKKVYLPFIIMPLSDDIHPDEIRTLMFDFGIAEIEHHESFIQHLMEYLGF